MWESNTSYDGWVKAVKLNGEKIRFRISDLKRYESEGENTRVKFYYGEEQLLLHPIEELDNIIKGDGEKH